MAKPEDLAVMAHLMAANLRAANMLLAKAQTDDITRIMRYTFVKQAKECIIEVANLLDPRQD